VADTFSVNVSFSHSFQPSAFMRHKLLFLIILLLATWVARAQVPTWMGATGITAGIAGNSVVQAVATNAAGDVFVAGIYNGTATFDGTTLSSSGGDDLFVAKWNTNSNSWAWAVSGGGSDTDGAYGLAVNGTNVYVTGSYTTSASISGSALTAAGLGDMFVAKYVDNITSAGNGGAVSGGGTGSDRGTCIGLNGSTVYVAGYYTNVNGATISGSSLAGAANNNVFLAKYTDANGLQPGGAVGVATTGTERATSIAVNGTAIYIGGYFNGSSITFGNSTLTNAGGQDLFIARYTDTGTLTVGTAVSGGGATTDRVTGLAVNGTNVYATGFFDSGSATIAGSTLSASGSAGTGASDIFVAKYTYSNGAFTGAGAVSNSGSSSDDQGLAIAANGSTVYVTGFYSGATTLSGTLLPAPSGGTDVFVAKYNDVNGLQPVGAVGGGTSAIGTTDIGTAIAATSTQAIVAGVKDPTATATFGSYSVGVGPSGFFARAGQTLTTVSSIVPASVSPTNASSVQFTVTFAASIAGLTTNNFATAPGNGITGSSVASVSGSGTTYTVTVNTGSGSGTLGLTLANDIGITPSISNEPFTGTTVYTIDKTAPAAPVVVAPANGSFVATTTPTYTGTAEANSTVTVIVDGSSIGTTTANGSGNWALTQPTALAQGSHTVRSTATDALGNVSPSSNTNTFTVDSVRPSVTISSSAGGNGSTTGTSPIPFTITFSERVSGFVAGAVTVTGGTLSGFSGSGTTYTVNVTPSASGNTVTVNVAANTVQDAAGNGNTAAAQFSITYQQPAVTVTSVIRLTPSPTATPTVNYRVVFSGNVTGLTQSNFSLTTSGLSGAAIATLSGSNTTYTVTVNTGTGDGTLRLNVVNATGASPTVSNVPYTSGEQYTITKSFVAAPTLRIQAAGSASNNGDVTAFVDVVQVLQSGTSTAVTNGLQNTSFETNNVDPSGFKKTADGVVASPWLFTGLAGVSRNNSGFGSTAAAGDAVGLLQSAGDNNASLSQNLAVPTGSYQVRFRAIQRNYTSLDQRLNVFVNDVYIGTIQPNNIPTYDTFTSASFNVTAPALTATVSTNSASPTSTTPIPFAVTFSQSVGSTFTASDVTVSGGTLTSGSFSGSGAGPYTFTVTPSGSGPVTVSLAANVTNDANNTGNAASNAVSVQFQAPTITLAPTSLPNGTQGTAYSQALTTSGGAAPYTYAITAGALPSGLTLSSSGTISGTPTANGTYNFTVTATDNSPGPGPYSGSRAYTLTINAPTITLSPTTLPGGTVGVAYSQTLMASGGTAPYSYAISAGALPAGLTLSSAGVISGTPTGGTSTFTVTATDESTGAGPYSGARGYTLTIAAPSIVISPASLPNGTQGTAYSQVLSASGGTAPYSYAITAGALPSGLTLASDGTLSGTPAVNGSFTFTVTTIDVSTGAGPYSGSRSYTLTIAPQPVTAAPIVTAPANGALINTATPTYTGTATASSTVTVYVDNTSVGTTIATGGGTWSLTQLTALGQGNHQVRATAQLSGQAVSGNSNQNSFTVDTVAPAVVIASSAGASGSTTGTSPIPFTVTFSEPVTGFVAADLNVSGGRVASFAGSGTNYTFEITPAADGLIAVDVPANVAQDQANNGNTAAAPFSLTYSRPVTATPVVVTPANGSVITTTKPTYTGTATASASLTVVVDENTATSQTTTVNVSGNWTLTQLSDLAPGAHTVQARAQSSGQTASAYSSVNTFTIVVLPTVVTATPSGVSSSGATLGGEVTDAGAGTISERGVVYVVGNGTPTTSDTKVIIGAGTGSFAQAVTNLTPSTTYAVRAYAINQAGTSYGATQLVSTGNALAIGSVTPEAVCAGGTISVAYTNSLPGTPLTVYLNGPSTSNLLVGAQNAGQASGTITATIPADRVAGQYSVYLSGGGTTSGSVNVTVNAIPSAPTTTPVTACQNTTPVSLAIGVTATGSLQWYTAATGGTASANAPVPPTSSARQTTYYVSQVVNGCESSRAALTYTVNPLPGVTLTSDGPLSCTKPAVTLTAGGSGSAYRFSSGATPIGTGNQATVSLSGTYSVTVTDGNGCSATAQTVVGSDQSNPQAGLTNDGPLTCAKTTVTLTAVGNGSYQFSAGATPIGNTNQATVTTGGVYSVTVTAANGCSATAQTTVEVNTTVAAPTLTASALSTENTPINVTASGCSGTINWTATGGSGTANGSVYTFAQPGNYGLTATCTVGSCTSPAAPSLTLQIRPGGFAIRGVELVRCQLVDAGRGQYEVSLTPQYNGLSGSPLSFGITNELAVTTAPGPYTIRLYTDNPAITLTASQDAQQASYRYSWLAACNNSQPAPNRAPVAQPIPDQVLVVGQPYQLELSGYFADPDGQVLTFTARNLPAGLSLSGSRISGSPTQAGTVTVTLTALDPGGLQAEGSVVLRVDAAPVTPTPGVFSIAGVTGVRCETVSASERRLIFSPVYTGLTGAPISFGITNEVAITTAPGPYSLRLYTDNPAITLTATQGASAASYRYEWLAACASTPPTPPTGNRTPVVGTGLGNQTAQAGQGYTLFIPAGTFTDPDNDALQLSVSGLPAGLSFSSALTAITGTPAQAGSSTVQVTATDGGGLSTSTSFVLTVQPAATSPTPGVFSIAGVTGVRCETVTASERRLIFSPVYTGLTGAPVSFGIINEVAPTSAPGPYLVRLYTDNPAITLTATQGGTQASYRYNWLAACATNPNGRQAVAEAGSRLSVVVLGNPVVGESVEVLIGGAAGQAVELSLTDLAGNRLHQQSIPQVATEARVTVPVSAGQAITILKVSTATQQQTVKLIRQ
jgi:hypothetical protein